MPFFYQPISGSMANRFPPRGSVILFIFLGSNPIGASNTLRDLWKTGSGSDFLGLTDGRPMVLNAGIGTD